MGLTVLRCILTFVLFSQPTSSPLLLLLLLFVCLLVCLFRFLILIFHLFVFFHCIPTGSPSRGGDVAVYVFDINQPSLPTTPFYSVRVSVSVFMALSTVFHSIHFPDKSPLSQSVLPGLISALLVFSTVYLFRKVSFSPYIILCG